MNDKHVGRLICILSNEIKRDIDKRASSGEFTGTQGRVLHYIVAKSLEGNVYQKDIEKEFNLRRSSATGILQAMEKNNLITRISDEYDARLKKIIVNEEKYKKVKDIVISDIQGFEDKLTKDIPKEKLQVFFEVMEMMIKNCE